MYTNGSRNHRITKEWILKKNVIFHKSKNFTVKMLRSAQFFLQRIIMLQLKFTAVEIQIVKRRTIHKECRVLNKKVYIPVPLLCYSDIPKQHM